MDDHRPAGEFRRSDNRTFRGVTIVAVLLALASTVYFATESLSTIIDLSAAAITGSITMALAWIIVGSWRARHQEF